MCAVTGYGAICDDRRRRMTRDPARGGGGIPGYDASSDSRAGTRIAENPATVLLPWIEISIHDGKPSQSRIRTFATVKPESPAGRLTVDDGIIGAAFRHDDYRLPPIIDIPVSVSGVYSVCDEHRVPVDRVIDRRLNRGKFVGHPVDMHSGIVVKGIPGMSQQENP